MRIESIELRNYRLFRHAKLTALPSMVTLVGANGSGKSTLFDALDLLKDALKDNVAEAVARRGGLAELVSRGESGPLSIVVTFRKSGAPSVAYKIEVAEDGGRPVVDKELLGQMDVQRGLLRMVNASRGKGSALAMSDDEFAERTIELEDPSALAIKGLGQFKEFRAASELRELLESWHISDIHARDAWSSAEAGYAEHLSPQGENMAQVARFLHDHYPDRFRRILEVMRARVPGVTSVEARSTLDGRLVLRFQDGSFRDPFIARYVSDGTIKMFAYLVLLHDPKPHPLLAVEEPENQLYPALLRELAEEFRDYARRGGQVLVSTHSPEFLNGAKLDEIYWFVKKDGFATVRRASESALLRDLYAEGDLPGALWKQRLFEGADPA